MSNELGQFKEGLPTLAALKGPRPDINSLVVTEARYLYKEYTTVQKAWLHCGLSGAGQVGVSKEGLPTFPTLIKLFSSVDILMVYKFIFMAEGFLTSALVTVLCILKGLSTCGVPMWLPHIMRSLLLEKAYAGCEFLPTFPARKGPLSVI